MKSPSWDKYNSLPASHAIVTVTVSVISHRCVFLNEPTADNPGDTNYEGQDKTSFIFLSRNTVAFPVITDHLIYEKWV